MRVSDYLYEAKVILETALIGGLAYRGVNIILKNGIEEGDWTRTADIVIKLVWVGILGVCAMEILLFVKKTYFGG